jgi:hypothetical protein
MMEIPNLVIGVGALAGPAGWESPSLQVIGLMNI